MGVELIRKNFPYTVRVGVLDTGDTFSEDLYYRDLYIVTSDSRSGYRKCMILEGNNTGVLVEFPVEYEVTVCDCTTIAKMRGVEA